MKNESKTELRKPVNIWNDIERCSVLRLDIVFEGKTIVGIHNSDFTDIENDIDWLCNKLNAYKSEMATYYEDIPPVKRSMLKTYIYLIYDRGNGLYKIGRSINPATREKTLQSEKPNLQLIWISSLTDKKNEKILHDLFKSKRVRGEWFRLSKPDIEIIKDYNYGS